MKKAYNRLIKPILNEAKLKGEIETVPAWYNVLEKGHKLRQSKKAKETNPKAPPPIIIRFSSKYMTSTVLRNKKKSIPTPTLAEVTETGVKVFRIAEDLTVHNFFLLRNMWDDARVENARTIDGRIRYTKAGETDVIYHTCRKCELTMAACSVLQRHMTSGSVIQNVRHCQMSYDAAGCQNDAAGCQNDAAKPHFEGSQDTWIHGFLHVWDPGQATRPLLMRSFNHKNK